MKRQEGTGGTKARGSRGWGSRGWVGRVGAAVLLGGVLAAAADASVPIRRFTRTHGLPSSQVHAVRVDAAGIVWAAGPSGLVRYDGSRIRTFGPADGLSTQGLRSLHVDPEGRLWVGTDVGVDHRVGRARFDAAVPVIDWPLGLVEAMVSGSDGSTWIAGGNGLGRLDPAGELHVVDAEPLRSRLVAAVRVRGNSVLAVVPSVGLIVGTGEDWSVVRAPELGEIAPLATLDEVDGRILVGGRGGLVEWDGAESFQRRLTGSVTASLTLDDEFWLGLGGQLWQFPVEDGGTRWERGEVILPDDLVNDLAVDSQRNLWAGTDAGGLVRVSILRRVITIAESPCAGGVLAIRRARDGEALLVGGARCAWRASSADGTVLSELRDLRGMSTWDLLEDSTGYWVATSTGLWRVGKDGRLPRLRTRPAELTTPGRTLLEDGERFYYGTLDGLFRVEGGVPREVLDRSGKPLGYVYTLARSPDGAVWVGTLGSGLWRVGEDGAAESIVRAGLGRRANTYSIDFREDGLMAVLQDDRLLLIQGSARRRTGASDWGSLIAGWAGRFDADGSLWVGGMSGLSHVDAATGETLRAIPTVGAEFLTSRSLFFGEGRVVWGGLDAGLAAIDRDAAQAVDPLPGVVLVEENWQGVEPVRGGDRMEIPSGRWTARLSLAVPWYVDDRHVELSYRIEGFDETWLEIPGPPFDVQFTGLPPGDYRLVARGESELVGPGPETPLLAFSIVPPWWQTAWATSLGVLIAAIGLIALGGRRTAVARRRADELERLVEARAEELVEVNRSLRQQARTDYLTGCLNRRGLMEELERFESQALRERRSFVLLSVDIDGFKDVNDRYGHAAGDDVLIEIAQRLLATCRRADVVGRVGGDEFAVVAWTEPGEGADRLLRRVEDSLHAAPMELSTSTELPLAASVGLAEWRGEGDDLEDLLQRADDALYAKKAVRRRR